MQINFKQIIECFHLNVKFTYGIRLLCHLSKLINLTELYYEVAYSSVAVSRRRETRNSVPLLGYDVTIQEVHKRDARAL